MSLCLLFAGVFRLSVIRGGFYQALARDNRIMQTKIPAARGEILDRKGRVVAQSVYQYYKLVGSDKVYQGSGSYQGDMFEGKGLSFDLKRQYPYGESMGLLTGYVGLVNQAEMNGQNTCQLKLDANDLIGRGGLEQTQDCDLRGEDGQRLVEVDAKGNYIRELGRQEPVVGRTLNLSINAYWQDKIYKMLDGKKAVVIMSEPKTGKIIAMVSSPAIDPNAFTFNQDNNLIQSYLDDKNGLPMLDRAIAAKYSPGSVFKIVMSTGGLESGVITKDSTFLDTGIIKVGDYSYTNWLWTKDGVTDGQVSVVKGLQRSNDVYFYQLGQKMGLERIDTWARNFGYGAITGVELPGELSGLVPDGDWKQQMKGENWYLGDTYHLSIGQGDLEVTPLQVNQMTNVIAADGNKCQPSLLLNTSPNCQKLPISQATIDTVLEGMKAACKPGGTAWPLFNFKTSIACKTGTAQIGDGTTDENAWLTAFAPADDPEISITVMVERGGEGSDVAAPIVGDILKEWFDEPNTLVPRHAAVPGQISE